MVRQEAQYDDVYDLFQSKCSIFYTCDVEKRTPFVSLEQTFIKKLEEQPSYSVYDILKLESESFSVRGPVILMTDGEIFELTLVRKESESTHNVSETLDTIQSIDSTSVSVVTGYSYESLRIEKLKYYLEKEHVEAILSSAQIRFRYYSEPDWMTVEMRPKKLRAVKTTLLYGGI